MSRNLCSVKGCRNTKHEKPFLSFHFFPTKEPERLKKWVEFCENDAISQLMATNDPKLEHKSICSEHFEDNKYNNPMKKIRLMCNAVPTLKNKKKKPTDARLDRKPAVQVIPTQVLLRTNLSRRWQPSKVVPLSSRPKSDSVSRELVVGDQVQTDQDQTCAAITPKQNPIIKHFSAQHIRYEDEVKSLREKLAKTRKQAMNLRYRLKKTNPIGNTRKSKLNFILNNIKNISEDVLNPIVYEIIEYHLISAFLNKPRVPKWSNQMKKFCADIYHKSPSAYSLLQKTLTLPTKKTIFKFIEHSAQMAKMDSSKVCSEQVNKSLVRISEMIAQDKFYDQQLVTLDPIDGLLTHNELSYINIQYSTCDQTSDQTIASDCIDLNPIEINVSNAVTIDGNNAEKTHISIESPSKIKTYSKSISDYINCK